MLRFYIRFRFIKYVLQLICGHLVKQLRLNGDGSYKDDSGLSRNLPHRLSLMFMSQVEANEDFVPYFRRPCRQPFIQSRFPRSE